MPPTPRQGRESYSRGGRREASVGRTTAYRYFPNSQALLAATFPEFEMTSLLGADSPEDPLARLRHVAETLTQWSIEYEPEYRAQLGLTLEGESADGESLPLRRGRRIGWIGDSLAPKRTHCRAELQRLVYGIGATLGIEAFVWLTDMAGSPAKRRRRYAHERAHAAAFCLEPLESSE